MKKAGIIEDVCERGFIPGGINWKKLDMSTIASIPAMPEEMRSWETGLVCLPLNQLGQLLLDHLARYPSAKILWSHEVVGIEQNENEATVIAKTPEGEKTFSADYIIGCDGANSKVRRSLFGDWTFPGFTWEEQIVATNVLPQLERRADAGLLSV